MISSFQVKKYFADSKCIESHFNKDSISLNKWLLIFGITKGTSHKF